MQSLSQPLWLSNMVYLHLNLLLLKWNKMSIQVSLEAFTTYPWLDHCYILLKLVQIFNSLSTLLLSSVEILIFLILKLQNVFFTI